MTPIKKKEVVKFAPNVPVEVALKFALPGKVVSTQSASGFCTRLSMTG